MTDQKDRIIALAKRIVKPINDLPFLPSHPSKPIIRNDLPIPHFPKPKPFPRDDLPIPIFPKPQPNPIMPKLPDFPKPMVPTEPIIPKLPDLPKPMVPTEPIIPKLRDFPFPSSPKPKPKIIEMKKDEKYVVSKKDPNSKKDTKKKSQQQNMDSKEKDKKLKPEDEPLMFSTDPKSLVQDIINLCRNNTAINSVMIVWDIAMLYGKLTGMINTQLVRMYFQDAEDAIKAQVLAKGGKMTEEEFKKIVETNIDYAYERSLQLF